MLAMWSEVDLEMALVDTSKLLTWSSRGSGELCSGLRGLDFLDVGGASI